MARKLATPIQAGVLSALGMLAARPGRQLSRSHVTRLDRLEPGVVEAMFEALRGQGLQALQVEGFAAEACTTEASVDLRYLGQSYTLNLPWTGIDTSAAAFHEWHDQRYGHRLDLPVELVNLRMAVRGPQARMALPALPKRAPATAFRHQRLVGIADEAALKKAFGSMAKTKAATSPASGT